MTFIEASVLIREHIPLEQGLRPNDVNSLSPMDVSSESIFH